jgi:hypothetical protein
MIVGNKDADSFHKTSHQEYQENYEKT